jgi:hypothetical protein
MPLSPTDISDKLLLLISKSKISERHNDLVWIFYYNCCFIIINYFL